MSEKVELPLSMYLLMFLQLVMTGYIAITLNDMGCVLGAMYLGI